MLVVRQRQQPLQLIRLERHDLLGVPPALAPDRHSPLIVRERGDLPALARGGELLHHLVLDRQPVAVPPRHEPARTPLHQRDPHHEVLQALVQQVSEVDVPVGVGRPVVEHERGPPPPRLEHALIQPGRLPSLPARGLALRQVRLHGKGRPGQVQRVLVGPALLLARPRVARRPAAHGDPHLSHIGLGGRSASERGPRFPASADRPCYFQKQSRPRTPGAEVGVCRRSARPPHPRPARGERSAA